MCGEDWIQAEQCFPGTLTGPKHLGALNAIFSLGKILDTMYIMLN